MKKLRGIARTALLAAYLALILTPCGLLAFAMRLPRIVFVGMILVNSLPVLATRYEDRWFFGEMGYHSPLVFLLVGLNLAVLLWPLPALAAAPTLWSSRRGKRVVVSYLCVFVLLSVTAAIWIIKHPGLIFD